MVTNTDIVFLFSRKNTIICTNTSNIFPYNHFGNHERI